jgi:hypothetical protein
MIETKHKVFISYHHANDQWYKEELIRLNKLHNIFIDSSVDTGDIDENLDDNTIRHKIRDEYLKDSSVTILLVGTETKNRKHIDWELYSSMFDGTVNKKSGVLVINLPSINCNYYTASHKREKELVYPENQTWLSIDSRAEYESRYPYMPARIVDNLIESQAKISVVNWNKVISNIEILRYLINETFNDRTTCKYVLSRPMRRANS